jgi:uncharacterized protein (TIGR00369 family)
MQEIVRYRHCFVCGDDNRHGLQARFYYDGGQAVTEITAGEAFEGYRGIYHGGIISTLLDEVMIKAILARDVYAVTVEISVRFFKPVAVGEKLRFTGRVTGTKGRLFLTEGEALGPNGEQFASATGKYIEAKPDLKNRLLESLGPT